MAVVKSPLMSLDASGSIGGAITFSKWKGRNYIRKLVTPANPQTGLQVGMRAVLRFTSQYWKSVTAGNQATWAAAAKINSISPFNQYIAKNQNDARQNIPAAMMNPATGATTPGAPTFTSATAAPKSVILAYALGATTDAIQVYRSTTTGFTPDISNLVAIVPAALLTYTDTRLKTGVAYFYRIYALNLTGKVTTLATQQTATPT